MGKADVNVNIWLSEKKRFANLFNGVIYGGRQVILPEDLEEVNPVSSVSVKNRTGKTKNMKKYRDIIMKWRNQATFVLLANESQDMVHYAMPHKVMLYDGMDYETQIRNNWKNFNDRRKQNKKTGQPLEHLTAGESLPASDPQAGRDTAIMAVIAIAAIFFQIIFFLIEITSFLFRILYKPERSSVLYQDYSSLLPFERLPAIWEISPNSTDSTIIMVLNALISGFTPFFTRE